MSQPLDYVSSDARRADSARKLVYFLLTVTLIAAAVAIGFQLNRLDDDSAVSRTAIVICFAGVIALIVIGAAVMGRARPTSVVIAVVFVLLAVFGSMALFDVTSLGRSVGYITGRESMRQMAINRFIQRLYLCAAPTLVVSVASLVLSRRPREFVGILAALLAGAMSAALWAGELYGLPRFWLTDEKRAKFLSLGLFIVVLLLLCQLLAGAVETFRRRHGVVQTSPTSDPGYTQR